MSHLRHITSMTTAVCLQYDNAAHYPHQLFSPTWQLLDRVTHNSTAMALVLLQSANA